MTFNEIENHIKDNGAFAIVPRDGIGYSAGILLAIDKVEGFAAAVEEALDKFCIGDFGDFYEYGEKPTPGREFGSYESPLGNDLYTGAIVVHREPMLAYELVVYFQFER